MESTLFNPMFYCGGEEIENVQDIPCPYCHEIAYPCACGADDDEIETPLDLGTGGHIVNQGWLQGEA